MRKIQATLLLMLMMCLLCAASGAEETKTEVYMEKTSIMMTQGSYGWLRSGIRNLAYGTRVTEMTWESTDESVVRIGTDAKYVAVGRGEAQLIRRVKTSDGKEYTGVCDVRVVIPVDEIRTEMTRLVLVAGKEEALPEVHVIPEDADVQSCTWSVNHPETVSIEDGKLRALQPGTAVLTATSDERISNRMLRYCTVQVTVIPAVESLKMETQTIRLEEGKTETLSLQTKPAGMDKSVLHFASSSEETVSVSPDGKIRGLKTGSATVTVWTDQTVTGERLEVSVEVEVYRKIRRLSFSPGTLITFRGQTVTLSPEIEPADADLSALTLAWRGDSPYVASVRGQGLAAEVSCRQVGHSVITVTAQDGSRKRAGLHLRVEPSVPVKLREVTFEKQESGLALNLRFKNRMRETRIQEIALHYALLDAQEKTVAEWDEVSPFVIRPTLFAEFSVVIPSGKVPGDAAVLEITVTGIRHAQGFYEIPSGEQAGFRTSLQ